ncbi:MAG: hypothetical protein M3431_01315 [Actinomycetota bacterium]|nr:hypothetical protein [Actinomycetota bacterium]
MTRTRHTVRHLTAACAVALVPARGLPLAFADSADDDLAVAEAAMRSFNERMVNAGFVSEGPQSQSDEMDPEEAEFIESECMQATGLTMPRGSELPGQTARAFSDEFKFVPEPTTPGTDGPKQPVGDYAFAFVTTVDSDHRDDLDGYIDYISSEARLTCLREMTLGNAEASAPAPADPPGIEFPQPEFEFTVETDLGIGDRSARVDLFTSTVRFDEWFELEFTILLAKSDRSLVFLGHGTGAGGPLLDVDVEAELQALVDSL